MIPRLSARGQRAPWPRLVPASRSRAHGCRGKRWRDHGPGALQASCVLAVVATALVFVSCGSSPSGSGDAEKLAEQDIEASITVRSAALAQDAPIPPQYSCDGDDVSPPLSWDGVPKAAVDLALVVDDPDASGGTYVRWVLFGLDPSVTELEEGEAAGRRAAGEEQRRRRRLQGPMPAGG
jgi:Phosphatidylethanolamine-binding protein